MNVSRLFPVAVLVLIPAAVIATSRGRAEQAPANWRARFTAAALQIPFDSERPPVRDAGVPSDATPAGAPKMTIASARTRDTGQVGRLDARITSDRAYPRLGIAPGVNYVWRDFVGGKVRQLVIPADTAYATHWLSVAPHGHAPPKKVPRLVIVQEATLKRALGFVSLPKVTYVIGVCTGRCPSPESWCISADTTWSRSAIAAGVPLNELSKFLVRNGAAFSIR